jgi:hypothetical protein
MLAQSVTLRAMKVEDDHDRLACLQTLQPLDKGGVEDDARLGGSYLIRRRRLVKIVLHVADGLESNWHFVLKDHSTS